MTYYINEKKKDASRQLGRLLQNCIRNCEKEWAELVFLCIGSDRITGDSLGPYIGHQLSRYTLNRTVIYGTLESPVHALNLSKTISEIHSDHPNALVIAIDASLGAKKHLGYITVGNGSIRPGAGVRKDLPPVGDIYITGIVCASGFLDQLSLQNTRLAFVISMADTITRAILSVYANTHRRRFLLSDAFFHLPEGRFRKVTKSPPFAAFTEDKS